MAFRKKPAVNNPDDVEKAQEIISGAAADVTKAAEKFNGIPLNRFITKDELKRMKEDVDGVNDLFDKQERDLLKELEVRVMKYDPNGRITDVTDKIRPGDIRPEEIVDVRADRNLPLPRNADGKLNQEGALDLLTALLGGGRGRRATPYFDERRQKLELDEMEAAINDAEKILQHWKK